MSRKLNSYTASPDGKCEWCMKASAFLECDDCVGGPAVDAAVRLAPPRKAKCGHPSFNYFTCQACMLEAEDHTKDLYGFTAAVRSFDLRKLGATNANGTIESSISKGNTKRRSAETIGTTFDKKSKKWRAQISLNGVSEYLGLYNTKEEAQETYRAKREQLFGPIFELEEGPLFLPEDDAVRLNEAVDDDV